MIAKEMIAEKVFAEGVAKDIRNFLPAKYENAEFQVMQMNKNNGVQMVGVQVRLQEENVCPVVYIEPFFNEIRLGEPVDKVMNEIARCMEEAGKVPFVHSGINPMDYDSVKEHLAVMLVNTQANKRMLQEMPHENIEDLSAICYVDFPVESNDGKATMKVKNEHLKMWNVDAKEMFHQARANTQPVNTPILQSMDEMMLSIFNEEGHATNLIDENVFSFCWIVDFPMYELNEHGKLDFCHNPFSMPQGGLEALKTQQPLDILAYQYDIVCNGIELSSGAVRNHDPEIMIKAFELVGYSKEHIEEKFRALFNAFQYGAPPHAGIAPGVDRMLMLLTNSETVRDVIAFPMNSKSQDLLMGAPNTVTKEQLQDVHIKLDLPEQK